jgi:beta propeller repeat protein
MKVDARSDAEYQRIFAALMRDPAVEDVEPSYLMKAMAVPDDPLYDNPGGFELWNLKRTDMAQAWDTATGAGLTVAVIDTGIDVNHVDLAGNIWTNSAEQSGSPGVDDDGNGFVDDVHGWSFVTCEAAENGFCTKSVDPGPDVADPDGHGTHVAGTIGAVTDNGIGVAGAAPGVELMPVRVLSAIGGSTPEIVQGVEYAVENGAQILNLSLGSPAGSFLMSDGIKSAFDKGVIVVAAAGNDNTDFTSYSPAGLPTVITVASTDTSDKRSGFSNYLPVGQDQHSFLVGAPGGDSTPDSPDTQSSHINIISTRADGVDPYSGAPGYVDGTAVVDDGVSGPLYYRLRGTSMAAPLVSGIAAVVYESILDANPGLDLGDSAVLANIRDEVRARLILGVDPYPTTPTDENGVPVALGRGRINGVEALTLSPQPLFRIFDSVVYEQGGDGDRIPEGGENAELRVTLENHWIDAANVDLVLTAGTGQPVSVVQGNATLSSLVQRERGAPVSFSMKIDDSVRYHTPVHLSLQITADHAGGTLVEEISFTTTVGALRLTNSHYPPKELITPYYLPITVPSFSDDRIVWTDFRNDDLDVYLFDFETGQERLLSHLPGAPNSPLPDHQLAPVISDNRVVWQDDANDRWDLYSYDLLAGTTRSILISQPDLLLTNQHHPSLNGDRLVFTNETFLFSGLYQILEVYYYDLSRGALLSLAPDLSLRFRAQVYRNQIVYEEPGGNRSVLAPSYPTELSLRVPVASVGVNSIEPAVHNNRVAYTVLDDGQADVYTARYDHSVRAVVDHERLSNRAEFDAAPAVRGHYVAWHAGTPGGLSNINLKDLETGETIPVTTSGGLHLYPALSNERLVWSAGNNVWVAGLERPVEEGEEVPLPTPEPERMDIAISFSGKLKKKKQLLVLNLQLSGSDATDSILNGAACRYSLEAAQGTATTPVDQMDFSEIAHIEQTRPAISIKAKKVPSIRARMKKGGGKGRTNRKGKKAKPGVHLQARLFCTGYAPLVSEAVFIKPGGKGRSVPVAKWQRIVTKRLSRALP